MLALVSPREVAPESLPTPEPEAARPAPAGYTVRVGPLIATVEPTAFAGAGPADPADDAGTPEADPPHPAPTVVAVPSGAPARIGATIGALERLLIVAFVMTGAIAAVGFVIAAKTIARFKQLDDRGFAEYYLLGTLASVGRRGLERPGRAGRPALPGLSRQTRPARDSLAPFACEERLAVEADVERDPDVERLRVRGDAAGGADVRLVAVDRVQR